MTNNNDLKTRWVMWLTAVFGFESCFAVLAKIAGNLAMSGVHKEIRQRRILER
jgi:hypothetical protein